MSDQEQIETAKNLGFTLVSSKSDNTLKFQGEVVASGILKFNTNDDTYNYYDNVHVHVKLDKVLVSGKSTDFGADHFTGCDKFIPETVEVGTYDGKKFLVNDAYIVNNSTSDEIYLKTHKNKIISILKTLNKFDYKYFGNQNKLQEYAGYVFDGESYVDGDSVKFPTNFQKYCVPRNMKDLETIANEIWKGKGRSVTLPMELKLLEKEVLALAFLARIRKYYIEAEYSFYYSDYDDCEKTEKWYKGIISELNRVFGEKFIEDLKTNPVKEKIN